MVVAVMNEQICFKAVRLSEVVGLYVEPAMRRCLENFRDNQVFEYGAAEPVVGPSNLCPRPDSTASAICFSNAYPSKQEGFNFIGTSLASATYVPRCPPEGSQ
jgi:hypothetical protein